MAVLMSQPAQTALQATSQDAAHSSTAVFYPPSTMPTEPLEQIRHIGALCLKDGSIYHGVSFGHYGTSVAGECVFQTGTVQTYTRALTRP